MSAQKQKVLVVDDEETIRNLLKGRLEREGFEVFVASQADEAEKTFAKIPGIGVMVTDLKMPGKDGFALMATAKNKYPQLKVVVITGHGEKNVAIQALKQGASDYLEKPFDLDELTHSVRRAQKEHLLESENQELIGRLEARIERIEGKTEDQFWYVSKSASMAPTNEWLTVLRREAMRGGAEEPTVLILGESGTGKEGIARMVHAGSRRGKGPWIAVNCANFSEQLLESELFGHERGAFTGATSMKRGLFEIARGGTLFLDEIGEMDIKLQAKILRVLQEKTFRRVGGMADLETDVRIVAATNQDLKSKIQGGKFRDDLYHRLSRVVVDLPALRARKEDVVPMARQFAERAFKARGKAFHGFEEEAEQSMEGYSWPGNVRELLNVIERVALVWEGKGSVSARLLAIPQQGGARPAVSGAPKLELVNSAQKPSFDFSVQGQEGEVVSYTEIKKRWSDAFEREYLISILGKHGGNVSAASREAKIDRSNFLRLLRRHQIKAESYRKVAVAA